MPTQSYASGSTPPIVANVEKHAAVVTEGDSKNEISDMTDNEARDFYIDPSKLAELRTDLNIFKSFTLLDDQNTLNQLYVASPYVTIKNYMASVVSAMYIEKYKDLVEKYPALVMIINQLCGLLAEKNENEFAKLCSPSSTVRQSPAENFAGTKCFRRLMRFNTSVVHRAHSSAGAAAHTLRHPFLSNDHYRKHSILYELGKTCKYVIPICFAATCMKFDRGTYAKMLQGKSKSIRRGHSN